MKPYNIKNSNLFQIIKNLKKMWIIVIVSGIFIIFTIGIIALRMMKKYSFSSSHTSEIPIIPVYVQEVLAQDLTEKLKINGNIMAENSVKVMPDIGGKFIRYTVKVGDFVKKRQTLAFIDPNKPGTFYKLSPVLATLSGVISALPIEIGNTITTTNTIAEIEDLSNLKIETFISERFIGMVNLGKKAEVSSIAFPNQIFEAVIYELAPSLDPLSRTLLTKLRVTKGYNKLLSGMFCELLIDGPIIQNILAVPSKALIHRDKKHYVYIVTGKTGTQSSPKYLETLRTNNPDQQNIFDPNAYDGIVSLVPVELGKRVRDLTIITQGVQNGDRVITSGSNFLRDGSLVRILEEISQEEKTTNLQNIKIKVNPKNPGDQ